MPVLIAAWAASLMLPAWAAKKDKQEGPPPASRVDTSELGYRPLSSFYVMSRSSSSSLDFLDDDHVLFTYRTTGLLKRLAECQPDDQDQLIRAVVLRLPDGKFEQSAEWRMHDRGRYLWALGSGRFLVRQQDALMTTDAGLELRPFLQPSAPLRLVKLSPDARLLLIETDLEKHTEEQHRKLIETARAEGRSAPREDVQLTVLRMADRSVVLRGRALNVTDLPMIAEGYLETLPAKGEHWMLRYQPFGGEATVIGDVASACRPSQIPLQDRLALVSSCPERGDDHLYEAITIDGKRRWSYRWDSHAIWPTTAVAQNGSRIAFSTLRVAHPVTALAPIEESELQSQRVEVLDVETGKLLLTQYAAPILSGGQNFALSADGGRFAILRNNAIEVYELPSAGPTQRSAE